MGWIPDNPAPRVGFRNDGGARQLHTAAVSAFALEKSGADLDPAVSGAIRAIPEGDRRPYQDGHIAETVHSENRIKELKIGLGMERMPCGQFWANAVFFRIGILAYYGL